MSIQKQIEEASAAYYEGNPTMSDAEFDTLVDQAKNLEGYEAPVGFGYAPESRKVNLISPMLSLDKVHSADELRAWLQDIQKEFPHATFVVDPKWDGLPIQAVFEEGELVLAATRGNGFIGENVTEVAKQMEEVTSYRQAEQFTGIVNGEVVITTKDFERLNVDTEGAYTLPRSAAAGLLRRVSDPAASADYLSFRLHENELPDDVALPTSDIERTITDAVTMGQEEARLSYGAGIDGAVIKVSDQSIRDELGNSRSTPRWAVALKFEARSRETTLLGIRWTVGRTGRLIPSAHFEFVDFDNQTEFATLHNAEWMEELNLHAGDRVEILSRGDVIPYFNGVVSRNEQGEPFVIPNTCPLCSGPVDRKSKDLICIENCNVEAKLIYFFRAFDTKGIGPGLVSKLFDSGLLPQDKTSIVDVIPKALQLDTSLIANLEGAGEAVSVTYANETQRIMRSGTTTEWLVSLGIPGLAWSTAERLIRKYGSIPHVVQTLHESPGDLLQIEGFGETVIANLVNHIPDMYSLVKYMDSVSITPAEEEVIEIQHDDRWSGKNVVLTGTLPNSMSRNDAADWLIQRGANIQGGVTGKTDILVAGEKAGSKLAKAESLGIQIVNGEEFEEMAQK